MKQFDFRAETDCIFARTALDYWNSILLWVFKSWKSLLFFLGQYGEFQVVGVTVCITDLSPKTTRLRSFDLSWYFKLIIFPMPLCDWWLENSLWFCQLKYAWVNLQKKSTSANFQHEEIYMQACRIWLTVNRTRSLLLIFLKALTFALSYAYFQFQLQFYTRPSPQLCRGLCGGLYTSANLKCKWSLGDLLRLRNGSFFFVFRFLVIVTRWWLFDRYQRLSKCKGSLRTDVSPS